MIKNIMVCTDGSAYGDTAIEYGLIAAVVSMIIIGGSGSITSALKDSFSTISGNVASANAGG